MGKQRAARRAADYEDYDEDLYESKQSKIRNQSRRTHRKVQNAINSKDVDWLVEIEDEL